MKLTHNQQKLPHAKEIKIQCGGLLGLDLMVYDLKLELPAVRDVHGLVDGAIAKFGALEALPFSEIIKSISTYESRHRRT